MTSNSPDRIKDVIDGLCLDKNKEHIHLSDILDNLSHSGYAPLLIVPSLLIISPVGAIPGVPAICGVFIFFVAGQMLLGKSKPWLPEKVKRFKFDTEKFCAGLEKSQGVVKKFDRIFKPRLKVLADNRVANFFVSLIAVLISVIIIAIGFIPFLPDLFVIPLLFFSLGMMSQDGFAVALGYLLLVIAAITLFFIF